MSYPSATVCAMRGIDGTALVARAVRRLLPRRWRNRLALAVVVLFCLFPTPTIQAVTHAALWVGGERVERAHRLVQDLLPPGTAAP